MKTETKRKFYVAVDTWGYPYGDAHESREAAGPDARGCANLAPGASNEFACRITEVDASDASEAWAMVCDRAVRDNSR